MIKILHIVHALTRGGGLSNFVMNYYRNIDRTKIQFDFVYFRDVENSFIDEITSLGGKCYKMKEPSLSAAFYKERDTFFAEHEGEYKAIHCHALFAAAFYGKSAKKHGISNVIIHSHNVGYGVGLTKKIRNYLFVKKGIAISTHQMACSKEAAEFMFGKNNVSKGRIHIISNAIECKKHIFTNKIRENKRNELNLDDSFVIGHVGGFTEQKNHEFIIDVFNEVCKQKDNSVLILAGGSGIANGSTLENIKNKVKNYGLEDKVKFLGVRQDVNELMMAMDSFIFPSIFEGFGLVLVEAQSSGLPCFASTNVPTEAKCTELVKYLPLDAGAKFWADEILNHTTDSRLVSLQSLDKFNIESQAKYLEDIYLSMN